MTTHRASVHVCDYRRCDARVVELGDGGQVRRAALAAGWRRMVVNGEPGDYCPTHVTLLELVKTTASKRPAETAG